MKQHRKTPPRINRRSFLQIIAAAGVTGALWQFGLRPDTSAAYTIRQSRVMMGTQINLIVHGPDRDSCEAAVDATFARMEELVAKLSRHDPKSELSTLNSRGVLSQPSREIREVLHMADHLTNITNGAFDITVLPLLELYTQAKNSNTLPPGEKVSAALGLVDFRKIFMDKTSVSFAQPGMAVTLDGIGKGYIVDQGAATLRSYGFNNVYVEAGGDLMVSGTGSGSRPWRIGITRPRSEKTGPMATIDISNRAVATSGDYMQPFTPDLKYHHIIDPRTGISPPELASATILAPTVALADGLATAAMVMGAEEAVAVLQSLPDCEGYFIGKNLDEYRTKGFPG